MPAPEYPIPDLLKAVNEASGKAFALWITFLTVITYLVIATGTTTHRQLLLAEPVKMPLLSVDMPLVAFYGFAPPVFVVLHLYVLMQLYLLARLLRRFDDDLRSADMVDQDRQRVRDQLDKFVFTQSLIGLPQDGAVRWFLRMAVWLSFIVGPALLLFVFLHQFLPYHSLPVVIVQLVTFVLDLLLLLVLWPKIAGTQQVQPSRAKRVWRLVFCSVGWFAAIAVFLFLLMLGEILVGSHSLVLVNERLVEPDEDKLSKLAVTLQLRGRYLQFSEFSHTDFRKADLNGAFLLFADLDGANLDGANLSRAKMLRTTLREAALIGANLSNADLSNADLSLADLTHANLAGADLTKTHLLIAKNITQEQLDQACGTDAELPPSLKLKPCPK